jgi:predicted lipoprotein with Yx(FWY)xxD motif
VVDGTGRTVYVFDQDVPGATTSACTGACASLWHAVPAGSPTPAGLTGAVGSIRGTDGGQQATLAGHPLYTYAGDSAAGQTSGQGVMGIWWVVDPAGQEITGSATSSPVGVPGY